MSKRSASRGRCAADSTIIAHFAARAGAALTPAWKIEHPTLVLWGDSDAIIPIAWSDNLKDYFNSLTFRRLDRCGHFCQREAPERVNREITEFLSRA
jgi:pimeloyl-ACP methyl ester carboxylesterase